ncbi:sirohydrochlorin cobaltochelatase [Trichloromonas sp.]|uniref:sirohydrochlorin cobaltochelatase n=1 Tax=Trichloromonas sp. TaxID=3069249 RepID=UPI001E08B0EF|nr:sirohydrochlorin cobaltochelatase [Desulfuromonadaceae bacterium]MDY0269859.1 sirohydrochlorin cobaltochelatase [Trichloromonas sp.]
MSTPNPAAAAKPTIVLVAFGTSVDSARRVFDNIYVHACRRYPKYDIQWAFTSRVIIHKLKQLGITTRYVGEVVDELRSEGVSKIAFQSLHVVPGQEYRRVLDLDLSGLQVAYGNALMTSDEDVETVITALASQIDATQPTVLVAHGNDHHPEFNERLLTLAEKIEQRYPRLVVASVEGDPGTEPLEKIKPLAAEHGSVRFVPLMIVAGDHVLNDVMGDDEGSWKNIISANHAECVPSLGWNKSILEIYFAHLDKVLAQLESR